MMNYLNIKHIIVGVIQEYLFIRCKIWNRIKNYLNKLSIYIYNSFLFIIIQIIYYFQLIFLFIIN